MPKFEYLVKVLELYPPNPGMLQSVALRFGVDDALLPIDELGKDGWELVLIHPIMYSPQKYIAIFKRESAS